MALTIHREPEKDRLVRVGYGDTMPEKKEEKAEERRGIVVTGDERFEGKQGFVDAKDAEAAGLVVTGLSAEEREPAAKEEEAEAPKAGAKKASKSAKK